MKTYGFPIDLFSRVFKNEIHIALKTAGYRKTQKTSTPKLNQFLFNIIFCVAS